MILACLYNNRGKLEVLQKHYQLLSKKGKDSVFDADCKEEVEDMANGYSSLSEEAYCYIIACN